MRYQHAWHVSKQAPLDWYSMAPNQNQPERSKLCTPTDRWSELNHVESDYVPSSSSSSAFQEIYPKGISDIPKYSQYILYSSDSSARSCFWWLWPASMPRSKPSGDGDPWLGKLWNSQVGFSNKQWSCQRAHECPKTLHFYRWLASNTAPTFPYHVPLQLDIYIYSYLYLHICSTAQGGGGSFRIGNL